MAGEIATAFVRVQARTDKAQFKSQVDKDIVKPAADAGHRAGSGFTKAFSTVMKTGAAAGVASVGLLAGAVAKSGFAFNNMREQAQIAFTTMLHSGTKAKDFLDQLQQFAAQTPFEFPDLVQSSQRLLAMGFTAKEIIPTMTSIGDAVAGLGGSGEMVQRVTTAFGQMHAAGRANLGDIRQLTDAGIPAFDILAKKLGKTVPDLMKMISKGSLDSQTAISALTEGMNKRFGGMMQKQSQTVAGLLSTLKDDFAIFSGKAMEGLMPIAKVGVQGIIDKLQDPAVIHGAQTFSKGVAKGIISMEGPAKQVAAALGKLYDTSRLLFELYQEHKDTIDAVAAGLSTAVTLWVTYGAAVSAALKVQAAMNVVMAANPLGLLVLAIAAAAAALYILYQRNEQVRAKVQEVWAAIQTYVATGVAFVQDLWKAHGDQVIAIATEIWSQVQSVIAAAWTVIQQIITVGIGVVTSVIETAKEWAPLFVQFGRDVATIMGGVFRLMQAGFQVWMAVMQPVFALLRVAAATLMPILGGAFKAIAIIIGTVMKVAWIYVSTFAQNLRDVIAIIAALINGDWGRAWDRLKSIVSRSMNAALAVITTLAGGFARAALALAKGILNGIENGLSTLFSVMITALAGIGHAISSVAGQVLGWALQLGSDLIHGIANGIAGAAGAIKDALQNALGDAKSFAKHILGISSPSKVMADEVGYPMVMGIAAGIMNGAPHVKKALNAATRDALAQAKQNMIQLGSQLGDQITTIMDAQTAKALKPLQDKLAKMQASRDAAGTADQRADLVNQLSSGKNEGESDADFIARQKDIRKQLADLDAQAREKALSDQIQNVQTEADARKAGVKQTIDDLTAKFNAGLLSPAEFAKQLKAVMKASGATVEDAGKLLGFAFQQQFAAQLVGVTAQIKDIGKLLGFTGGAAGGAGFQVGVTDPLDVVRDQLKTQKDQLHQDKQALRDAKHTKDKGKDDRAAEAAIRRDEKMIRALDAMLNAAKGVNIGNVNLATAGSSDDFLSALAAIMAGAAR